MPEGSGLGPGGVEGREGARRRKDRVGDGCAGPVPGDRSNARSAQQPWTDHVEEIKNMIMKTIKNDDFWETGIAWSGSGREPRGNDGNPGICRRPRHFIVFYHLFIVFFLSFFFITVCLIICLSFSTGLSFALSMIFYPPPQVHGSLHRSGGFLYPSGRARRRRSGRAQVGRRGSGGAAWVPYPHVPRPVVNELGVRAK